MTSALLLILLLIPLIGAAAVAFLPRGRDEMVRPISLITTLIALGVSIMAATQFDWSDTGRIQLLADINWVESFGLSFSFGVDSVSLWLVLLTTFLMPIVVLGSFSAVSERVREFFIWLLVLQTAMIGTFVATDVLFFYICFEFTLVPLYFLIGIYGSTQRLKAAKVFFLYTFTGSMLTFAGVLFVAWFNAHLPSETISAIRNSAAAAMSMNAQKLPEQYHELGSWSFRIQTLVLAAQQMSATQQAWVLGSLLAGFAVKVPLFPVHTWLPLAHTEAPTAGSVILAGVLLKLGTYGLLRLAIPLCPQAAVEYAPIIGALAVIGILYAGLICWVQKDIKKLIAYSSVSHLGFCVLGLFALGSNVIGPGGAVMYMINHGLSTGALFLCVGMVYERFHTREMRQYGGMAKAMPVWSFFMVFFCMASVGLPGLNGFVGEFTTLMGAFTSTQTLGPAFAAFAGAGMIIGAIYILYMVGKVIFGPTKVPEYHAPAAPLAPGSAGGSGDASHHPEAVKDAGAGHGHGHGDHHAHRVPDLNTREIVTLVPLALSCLLLGLFPNMILKSVEKPVQMLTQSATDFARLAELDREPPSQPFVAPPPGVAAARSQPPRILPGTDVRPLLNALSQPQNGAATNDAPLHGTEGSAPRKAVTP